MTKPMNFPERKRQRQLGALKRFWSRDVGVNADTKALEHEHDVLCAAARLSSRSHVQTKKYARDRLRPFARISA